ncbi:pyridoxamine 5'-phosphate oxidase family protein [Streptomyces sp. NBC_00667]|uniref:pyridoxamine 5'-phosphate oxidase family protein n=1 Tax=unclassified Streptomyces TaxID=2593676 RepID=UPI003FA6C8F9
MTPWSDRSPRSGFLLDAPHVRWSQPVDSRYGDGLLIADRWFVVSRGDGTVPLEAVDPALDRVALAVVDQVELRRPTTARATLLAVTRLVGFVRDGAADPPATVPLTTCWPAGSASTAPGRNFATVATLNRDGGPQTSVVWIARDGDTVLFSTTAGRQKARNRNRA